MFLDIDECEIKGEHICGKGNCLNNVGSYTCRCEDGYSIKNEENPYCTDEDECVLGTHGCDKSAVCVNNPVRIMSRFLLNEILVAPV